MTTRVAHMLPEFFRFLPARRTVAPRAAAGVVESGLVRTVFLTDDDGPTHATELVLDVLKREGLPATFFLTGEHAASACNPDESRRVVQRMLCEGHRIGNHGFRHFPEKRSDYAEVYGDLGEARQQAAFVANLHANLTYFQDLLSDPDFQMPLVRLAGDGSLLPHCAAEVGRIGFRHVGWDVEFAPNGTFAHVAHCDWKGIAGAACSSPNFPAHRDVILIHGAHWEGKQEPLREVLRLLKGKGYCFANL